MSVLGTTVLKSLASGLYMWRMSATPVNIMPDRCIVAYFCINLYFNFSVLVLLI